MIIIGEKINGTRSQVKEAVLSRNIDYIRNLARSQAEAGADYLDVNAGTDPEREVEDLLWLIDVVQAEVDTPICIDSSTPSAIKEALKVVKLAPMINSINGSKEKLESFIPLIKQRNCPVIALCLDESKSGMPKTIEERMEILDRIVVATREVQIPDESLFVDPLIMTVATDQQAAVMALDCIKLVREKYPKAHITGGLSNVSFGLPNRSLVNHTFLTLAMAAGLDSAIVDPSNVELLKSLYATELLLGRDKFCRKYTAASKEGFAKKN